MKQISDLKINLEELNYMHYLVSIDIRKGILSGLEKKFLKKIEKLIRLECKPFVRIEND